MRDHLWNSYIHGVISIVRRNLDTCRQCKGAGSRYYLDMKAGKSFTLNFIVTATQVASQAFPLPIFLPSGDDSTSITIPEILVLADCLETRLTISPGLIDLGSCIVPSASSVRSAYEHNVTITNQQDSVLEWSCSPPTTEIVEGCKGVFTIAQLGGQLQPLESCTIKVGFFVLPLCPVYANCPFLS